MYVYKEDIYKVFQKALDVGAESLMCVEDQFYGDRIGAYKDPFGDKWKIAKYIRDVSEEEMMKAVKAFENSMG